MNSRPLRPTTFAKARPRVLVVDDDEPTLRLFTKILSSLGCTVTTADSADAARALCRRSRSFSFVLVDLTLRDADGADLVAELRAALGGDGAPPFAICSGRDRPATLPDGVVAYLRKPVTVVELMALVRDGLQVARKPSSGVRAAHAPRVSIEPEKAEEPSVAAPRVRRAAPTKRAMPRAESPPEAPPEPKGVVEAVVPDDGRDPRRER